MKVERSVDLGQKGELLVVRDASALFEAAAELFANAATAAIAAHGKFTVALSGGSTPKALFELLATEPWRSLVPWSKVHFFWGDERWVPSTDNQSNYRMTNEALLSKISVPAGNVHRVETDRGTPQEAAANYEQEILKIVGPRLKFDLILLGLGTNGHTASLFPHCPALNVRDRLVVSDDIEEVKMTRITFTAPLINDAQAVLFLLSGRDKAPVLRDVVRGPLDPQRLPSQLIEPLHGSLTWLADADAAADIR
jgi:6-phosphogluconolactonase